MSDERFGHLDELEGDPQKVFMRACQELINIKVKWKLYLDLFSEDQTRALLHDAALLAANAVEESLRVDLTMSICRLADPVVSCGESNLSFKGMETLFPSAAFREEADRFREFCKPLKKIRNKLMAHNDLKTLIEPENNLLPGIAKPDIEKILESAEKALNLIAGEYANTEFGFLSPGYLDGESLVFWLRRGWETRRHQ